MAEQPDDLIALRDRIAAQHGFAGPEIARGSLSGRLPAVRRAVAVAAKAAGYSHSQIGAVLGLTTSGATYALRRARGVVRRP